MVCVDLSGWQDSHSSPAPIGQYLKSYDPNAHGGRGTAEWTVDIAKAMVFPNPTALLRFWKQISKVQPIRPDGKPNRPLTAFSILVEPSEGNGNEEVISQRNQQAT